jgi:signal-transduction protein with cAMP-binding, CBS, and nucleotidyltransferase domain
VGALVSLDRIFDLVEGNLSSEKQRDISDIASRWGAQSWEVRTAKAFALLIPPEVQDKVCLLMLGSEGRGEQIQKTDQDNALILPAGLHWPDQQADLGFVHLSALQEEL